MYNKCCVYISAKFTIMLKNIINALENYIKHIEYAPYKWMVTIRDPFDLNKILICRRYQYLNNMKYDLKECFTYDETHLYAKEKYVCLDKIIEFKQIYEMY